MTSSPAKPATHGLIWTLEWQRATARRRLLGFNILIPLGLVLPVALSDAPPHHAAAVYAVLFALFATFGAAIPALRDAERGLVRRLALLPISARGLLLERALAGACMDMMQLLPALAVIAWSAGARAAPVVSLLAVLAGTLTFANLIGLWLAAFARSVAEGALVAAVVALLLLHASGVFRTAARGSLAARIEAVAPFRALHEALLALNGAGEPAGAPALLGGLTLLLLLTIIAAPRIVRSLRHADGR